LDPTNHLTHVLLATSFDSKEPSSGHNKNCKLETPYVAVGDPALYITEYIAHVYNNYLYTFAM
jgi:hypothetical protein